MERLTERIADGIFIKENHCENGLRTFYLCYEEKPNDKYTNCDEGYCAIEKLAAYEDAEEQGLLLRLPTEAYFIKYNIVRKGFVQELVYSHCRKLLLDIRYDDNSLDSYRGYVGNTVFLTQTEAEQKLKEMESD